MGEGQFMFGVQGMGEFIMIIVITMVIQIVLIQLLVYHFFFLVLNSFIFLM